uniref:Surfactant protein B n=1 Tax=Corvus moneduloides TaxID=1196302 RepID=A0A8C3GY60_CORMO
MSTCIPHVAVSPCPTSQHPCATTSPCPHAPHVPVFLCCRSPISHIPLSPCPTSPCPHVPHPRVPISPCPASPCPHVSHPRVPVSHISVSPCPHVPHPRVPVSHISVSPYPHVPMSHIPMSPCLTSPCPRVSHPRVPVSHISVSPRLTCPRCPLLQDVCAMCQQLVGFLRRVSNQSTEEKPQQVCATVNLCHGEPGVAPAVPVLEVPGTHLQGPGGAGLSPEALPVPLCWMCRKVVERAEAAVPVGSVAAAVAGLCRALPLPVAGACQCLAERYAALLLEGLLGRLGPRLLCRLFLACRNGDNWDNADAGTLPPPWVLEAVVVRLAECVREEDPKGVGAPALSLPLGPCALGPIFWCSGPEAARRCQALQHCQEHVWL